MHKLIHNHKNDNHSIWVKIVITLLGMSLLVLFFGVTGIIENKSPENLASLNSLSTSFITYFEYHALIITGALGFTLAVWFMEHH